MGGFIRRGGGADTSRITATGETVLEGKVFLNQEGEEEQGTMPNVGAVERVLTAENPVYYPETGYHNGEGRVSVVLQEKEVSPSSTDVEVVPDEGKVLSRVLMKGVGLAGNAEAADVVSPKIFYSDSLSPKTGSLPDKTGTVNHTASSVGVSDDYVRMKIPAMGKYGTENHIRASYAAVASAIGLTAEKLMPGASVLGVSGAAEYKVLIVSGNGGNTLDITGIGFNPSMVLVFGDDFVPNDDCVLACFVLRDAGYARYSFMDAEGGVDNSGFSFDSSSESIVFTDDGVILRNENDSFRNGNYRCILFR